MLKAFSSVIVLGLAVGRITEGNNMGEAYGLS